MALIASTVISGLTSMGNICGMQHFCTSNKPDKTLLIFFNYMKQSDMYSSSYAPSRLELFLNFI